MAVYVRRPKPSQDQSGETPPSPPAEHSGPVEGETAIVPDGTIDEVLVWVGDDLERAALALADEVQKAKPRVTLVSRLEGMTGAQ